MGTIIIHNIYCLCLQISLLKSLRVRIVLIMLLFEGTCFFNSSFNAIQTRLRTVFLILSVHPHATVSSLLYSILTRWRIASACTKFHWTVVMKLLYFYRSSCIVSMILIWLALINEIDDNLFLISITWLMINVVIASPCSHFKWPIATDCFVLCEYHQFCVH